MPLLRSKGFVLVCLLSLGCTIIRETFNIWTPVYLRDYLGYTMGNAAGMSAVFPGVGAVPENLAYSSAMHARHLRGCYLTRDSVYSAAALLRRTLGGEK
jgi:OPA family glycerol-3-phosphate transporter-like MFS transporter